MGMEMWRRSLPREGKILPERFVHGCQTRPERVNIEVAVLKAQFSFCNDSNSMTVLIGFIVTNVIKCGT